jgi:hypothetical protein
MAALLVISPCARRYDTWTSYAISLSSDSVAREAAPSSLGVGCDGYLGNGHCAIPRCFVHFFQGRPFFREGITVWMGLTTQSTLSESMNYVNEFSLYRGLS